ncbi:MAG: hypothetical protein O9282_02920 [Flavobacterium sp.]|uniref:hypothetical protein n=1 Tax=Flavobacterium sp. TaxID=239 RepID=UPI0022BEE7F1|nr:hypothetical protein [Flavobacterium sp.]MCZ8330245.1 hypothetical protein [Flavobacterium sp.]
MNCTQTNATRVDCTISIDSNGTLVVNAIDSDGTSTNTSETNYIIDTVFPVLTITDDVNNSTNS